MFFIGGYGDWYQTPFIFKINQTFNIVGKVRNSRQMNTTLVNMWIIAEKCPSQLSSGKIFWKLLTVKQQTGIQDLASLISLRFDFPRSSSVEVIG